MKTTKMRMYHVEFGVGEEPSMLRRSYFIWSNTVHAAVKEAREIKNRQEDTTFERWYYATEIYFKGGNYYEV